MMYFDRQELLVCCLTREGTTDVTPAEAQVHQPHARVCKELPSRALPM